MISWSLSAEILAFIMITIILFFFHDKGLSSSFRRRIFQIALCLALFSILLSIVCVLALEHYPVIPYWVQMALNNCYFVINIFVATALIMYLFDHLFEFTDNNKYRFLSSAILIAITLIYTAIIISNTWTHAVFSIDAQGVYHRGPLNRLGYITALIEAAIVLLCYFRYRKRVGRAVVRVVQILPPLVILLLVVQYFFPNILLNGTIMAYTALIVFINFQSLNVEEDSLTRIGNRKSFCDEVDLLLTQGQSFQVIIVHLVNLGVINSRYSYKKGNELLCTIARWLNEYSGGHQAFRFGSTSFAIICQCDSQEEIQDKLMDISNRFDQGWEIGDITCHIPARYINMAYEGQDWDSTKLVEYLVYMQIEAKNKSSKFISFSEKIVGKVERKKHIQSLIKEHISDKSFEVWYQPIYNCKSKEFSAAEALVRMRNDDGSLISPGEFIPIAEEDEVIEEITWIVLDEVCRFLSTHRNLGLDCISVNLSARQLDNEKLYIYMTELLKKYNLPPEKIRLEITERLIYGDQNIISKIMEKMSTDNIGFCLDDFGTGYSNFVSVMRLPFNCVKMDKSLFDNIMKDNNDRFILNTMIKLFHHINLKVVAEGIEDEDQLNIVKEMGVDMVQGYIYARPMEDYMFADFCRRNYPRSSGVKK